MFGCIQYGPVLNRNHCVAVRRGHTCSAGLLCWTHQPARMLTMALSVYFFSFQIYHRSFKTKWRKLLACILGVTGASLASPFLGLLGSFLIVPLGLTYVYGIIPLHILWTSSFGRKMRVRLHNAFRRRTMPTQDDSNA